MKPLKKLLACTTCLIMPFISSHALAKDKPVLLKMPIY